MSAIRAVLYVLASPWFAVFYGVRAVRGLGRGIRRLRAGLSDDEVICAQGHRNSVLGRWRCGCGFVFLGRASAACPNCGVTAGWIECDRCGLGVRCERR